MHAGIGKNPFFYVTIDFVFRDRSRGHQKEKQDDYIAFIQLKVGQKYPKLNI